MAAVTIGTSPIWLPVLLVLEHKERAARHQALSAGLASGEVVLAKGESAGVDPARPSTAVLILRVTDVAVERDWTVRVPVAIPK